MGLSSQCMELLVHGIQEEVMCQMTLVSAIGLRVHRDRR